MAEAQQASAQARSQGYGSGGLKRADSIAIVFAHDREQHQHAKTVAHNRGNTNIDYFTGL